MLQTLLYPAEHGWALTPLGSSETQSRAGSGVTITSTRIALTHFTPPKHWRDTVVGQKIVRVIKIFDARAMAQAAEHRSPALASWRHVCRMPALPGPLLHPRWHPSVQAVSTEASLQLLHKRLRSWCCQLQQDQSYSLQRIQTEDCLNNEDNFLVIPPWSKHWSWHVHLPNRAWGKRRESPKGTWRIPSCSPSINTPKTQHPAACTPAAQVHGTHKIWIQLIPVMVKSYFSDCNSLWNRDLFSGKKKIKQAKKNLFEFIPASISSLLIRFLLSC